MYGVRKVWRQLRREGRDGGSMQVARLMREMGLQGAVRGRRFKTTKPDSSGARPMDLVERDFNATRPNELWVSDLTYVATWRGIVYLWRAFGRNPAAALATMANETPSPGAPAGSVSPGTHLVRESGGNLRVFENLAQTLVAVDAS